MVFIICSPGRNHPPLPATLLLCAALIVSGICSHSMCICGYMTAFSIFMATGGRRTEAPRGRNRSAGAWAGRTPRRPPNHRPPRPNHFLSVRIDNAQIWENVSDAPHVLPLPLFGEFVRRILLAQLISLRQTVVNNIANEYPRAMARESRSAVTARTYNTCYLFRNRDDSFSHQGNTE